LCVGSLLGSAGAAQAVEPNGADLSFILQQIQRAEAHAAGGQLAGPGPLQIGSPQLPYGLRTVNGTFNNIVPGQENFGAADRLFPRLLTPFFRGAEPLTFDPDGPGPKQAGDATSYADKTGASGIVTDSQPRTISNLIVDQSPNNPAAVQAASENPGSTGPVNPEDPSDTTSSKSSFFLPNVAPDVGLSAPYNSWFTLFGQFFDHGLDLLTKGGSGTVIIPLKSDDPLFNPATPNTNFMVLTRARNQKGPDGLMGTSDDIQEHQNTTTPFVDQNQTYTSHPAHQVFLREYELRAGKPFANGRLLDQPTVGGLARWNDTKTQAQALLGIALDDQDLLNVPLVVTDQYGRFIPHPTTGMAQIVTGVNPTTGAVTSTNSGTPGAPVDATTAVRTGHAFLDDIAHTAAPFGETDGNPSTPRGPLTPDADSTTGGTPPLGQYDNELLDRHFITGDGRGNENIGLSTVHHVFHAEHNLRVDEIKTLINQPGAPEPADFEISPGVWNGERLFQAARFVTEMEYQHLVFEEFARKVQPQVNLFAGYDADIDPAIVAEFAHVVYRFGHSMLTDTVARKRPDGTDYDVGLIPAFLNPLAFYDDGSGGTLTPEAAAGGIVRGMTRQVGNELDEFVTGSLRNNLLGLPLDLATINIARGRDTGVPSLNKARQKFFAETSNSALRPYDDWNDFKLGLRHQYSVVNFLAAYGTHPSITGTAAQRRAAAKLIVEGGAGAPADRLAFLAQSAATSGVDEIDFWVGGLAEKQMVFGGLLGSTFNFVFEVQMEKLQDADRLYYLSRNAGLNFLTQLEENSFSELINRTTDTKHLPFDVFSRPDFIFELANINANGAGPHTDDPATDYDESALLTKSAGNTTRFSGPEHVVFGGTPQDDRVISSEGDDTIWGDEGNDRIEGGDGVDALNGDLGDDIITDLNGDDNIKGGKGNDAINAGPGFDLLLAGPDNDFVVAGADPKETFAGAGNDFVIAGDSSDTVFGDEGDDWIEGGGQADLLQGEHGDPFQQGRVGDDVIDGGGGNDDYDSEGGDDIMVAGTGTERMEGQIGYDWSTYARTPGAVDADFRFTGLLPPDIDNIRDRFDLTEGLSGWDGNDILRGSDADIATLAADHTLTTAGIAKITGLQDVVGAGVTSYARGNIILGGNGGDTIEGRAGDDIIDGDKWLNVRLSVRDASNPATEIASHNTMSTLQAAVFAGTIKPGQIQVVREILLPTAATGVDTAVFTGNRANYTIVVDTTTGVTTVTDNVGTDGSDTLRNVERLQFADQAVTMAPTATPTPTPLAFGNQPTNTTSTARTVTLRNTGLTPLTLSSVTFAGVTGTEFTRPTGAAGGTCLATTTLAADATCTVNVVFRPTTTGPKTGTLRFTSNSGGVTGTQTDVPLTGTGVPNGAIATVTSTAAQRDFGNVAKLTTSPARTVGTLQNTGNQTLTGISFSTVAGNNTEFVRVTTGAGVCGPGTKSMAAGESCDIVYTLRPGATGLRTTTLRVTTNNSLTPPGLVQDFTMQGNGINGGITVDPSSLNFGSTQKTTVNLLGQVVGGVAVSRTVTVTSTGPGALAISSVQIVAAAASSAPQDYSVTGNTCGTGARAVGTTCTITVRFLPNELGVRNATLRLNTNAPVSPTNIPMTGTGTN